MRILYVLVLFIASCATADQKQEAADRPVERRTYEIAEDLRGFYYPYRVCTGGVFGIGSKCRLNEDRSGFDYVSFTDKEKLKSLRDRGFILKVEQRP
jgi:hypothetical protein